MKISELLDSIAKFDLVLPEFQREYVWDLEQAKQLLVSLIKEYPTGSLLFWKTDNPPDIKNDAVDKNRLGRTSVILDGLQRLTTLYLLLRDTIPPYYTERDILKDPRHLYFNLDTGDFQYFQKTRMENNPCWVPVVKCFSDRDEVDPFIIAEARQSGQEDKSSYTLVKRYSANLGNLRKILDRDIPEQIVPSTAHIDEAIDIFDRVNSLGTKLTDSELALAHICGKWPLARKVMKKKIKELGERYFYFDLTFMVRSLTCVVRQRALFETIHGVSEEELKTGWGIVSKMLDYLVNILPKHGFIHSTSDLNTTNVIIPLVFYLSLNEGRFDDLSKLKRALQWMYYANLWARYSSQTDQKLDQDISLIKRDPYPWGDLVGAIIDQRGRVEVKPDDFEGRSNLHPLYRMIYVLCKANGAIDWFNGSRLDVPTGKSYGIHNHHIFPRALLYSSEIGYSTDNFLHRKMVNDIANLAFLTGDSNLRIADEPPSKYLLQVNKNFPGAIEKQFVPNEPMLWQSEQQAYEAFLKRRRELLSKALNTFLDSLVTEPEPETTVTLEDLIEAGESTTLEFKGALRWDFRLNQVGKHIEKSIVKTIAAFLNTGGGTLVIGVSDEGDIWGIEQDINTLSRRDLDGFQQHLLNLAGGKLGFQFAAGLKTEFVSREGKTICLVMVEPSRIPVYVTDGERTDFFVRAGNTSRQLNVEEAQEYIAMRWDL